MAKTYAKHEGANPMWYLKNLLADLVNVIWFDLLGRPERVKEPPVDLAERLKGV